MRGCMRVGRQAPCVAGFSPDSAFSIDRVEEGSFQCHGAVEEATCLVLLFDGDGCADTIQLAAQPGHEVAEEVVGVQRDPFGVLELGGKGTSGLVGPFQVQAFGHALA